MISRFGASSATSVPKSSFFANGSLEDWSQLHSNFPQLSEAQLQPVLHLAELVTQAAGVWYNVSGTKHCFQMEVGDGYVFFFFFHVSFFSWVFVVIVLLFLCFCLDFTKSPFLVQEESCLFQILVVCDGSLGFNGRRAGRCSPAHASSGGAAARCFVGVTYASCSQMPRLSSLATWDVLTSKFPKPEQETPCYTFDIL